jgi:hypothetical protein
VDPNEPGGAVPCGRLTWSVVAPDTASSSTGCTVRVSFPELGSRTVTVVARDSHGATAGAAVTVAVVPQPANPPPEIRALTVRRRGGGAVLPEGVVLEPSDTPLGLAVDAADADRDWPMEIQARVFDGATTVRATQRVVWAIPPG